MSGDPPVTSSTIWPASGAVAWATDGVDCATPSNATVATSSGAGLVPVTITSAWASGGIDSATPSDTTVAASGYFCLGAVTTTSTGDARPSACGATPAMVDATGMDGSSIHSNADGGVTSVAACSTTTEGMGATADGARPANEAATSAPLLPKTGATSSNDVHPT
ncbi:uncharacterized protein [Miscanthus floridulus]|uniref:uncharacterized protein n=1 Tax=Miscanthus floridulus TaxID=154761 RepID=UPI0034596422